MKKFKDKVVKLKVSWFERKSQKDNLNQAKNKTNQKNKPPSPIKYLVNKEIQKLKVSKTQKSRQILISVSMALNKVVENYLLQEIVGSGQYGKVFKSTHQKTGEIFAVKVIKQEKFKNVPKLIEFTNNEVATLKKLNNPNVISFVEMLQSQNNVYLVYEFCNGGTLEDIIKKKKILNEKEALVIFQQIMNAFRSLFKEHILHRDLKPSNILLHDGLIKVADFGFCKTLLSPSDLTQTMVGSPIYMAPEILKGCNYNIKADIWSMGVVLFEMLFGYCPYEDKTIASLIGQINSKTLALPKHLNNISPKVEELLFKMLTVDPIRRIDWNTLLSFPLFEKSPILNPQNQNAPIVSPLAGGQFPPKYSSQNTNGIAQPPYQQQPQQQGISPMLNNNNIISNGINPISNQISNQSQNNKTSLASAISYSSNNNFQPQNQNINPSIQPNNIQSINNFSHYNPSSSQGTGLPLFQNQQISQQGSQLSSQSTQVSNGSSQNNINNMNNNANTKMKSLFQYRNIIQYLIKAVNGILELNFGETAPIVSFILMKILLNQSDHMKSKTPNAGADMESNKVMEINSILQKEIDFIQNCYDCFKDEINQLIQYNNKYYQNLLLKKELNNPQVDFEYFKSSLLQYVNQFSIENNVKNMQHINEVLNCFLQEEYFQNELDSRYNDYEYPYKLSDANTFAQIINYKIEISKFKMKPSNKNHIFS